MSRYTSDIQGAVQVNGIVAIKGDSVAVGGIGNRMAQRAGAAIVSVSDHMVVGAGHLRRRQQANNE